MPIPEIKEDDLDARIGKVIKQLCEDANIWARAMVHFGVPPEVALNECAEMFRRIDRAGGACSWERSGRSKGPRCAPRKAVLRCPSPRDIARFGARVTP